MSTRTNSPWPDCEIAPLNPGLRPYIDALEETLARNPRIVPDPKRPDFYTVAGRLGGFYIHLYGSTIYLVHYASSVPRETSVRTDDRKTRRGEASCRQSPCYNGPWRPVGSRAHLFGGAGAK